MALVVWMHGDNQHVLSLTPTFMVFLTLFGQDTAVKIDHATLKNGSATLATMRYHASKTWNCVFQSDS